MSQSLLFRSQFDLAGLVIMANSSGMCAALLLLILAIAPCSSLAHRSDGLPERRGDYRSGVGSIVTESLYNQFLPHRNDPRCPSRNFYNYTAFIQAAEAFPGFGTTGSLSTRKREIAAFFGQTSHETGGGSPDLPGGTYAWGYCYVEEINQNNSYCDTTSKDWPCAPGQKYFGRGPIQLSWNFNYGPLGQALGVDSLANPGLLAKDPVLALKAAFWFWMTPRDTKPSAHNVITGTYKPSGSDRQAKRLPGYGLITNIVNGGLECGPARNPGGKPNASQVRRIGYYQRYAKILGVGAGPNLSCTFQSSFA